MNNEQTFLKLTANADDKKLLLDPKKTPRIPKDIRIKARALLKHYPREYEMQLVKSGNNIFVDE